MVFHLDCLDFRIMTHTAYSTLAQELLKNDGHKLTKPRLAVIDILSATSNPLSAYDIVSISNQSLDNVTVYRALELLQSLHLVQKIHALNAYITADGKPDHDHCHVISVCTHCQSYAESVFENTNPLASFDVLPDNHTLEIVWLCSDCS